MNTERQFIVSGHYDSLNLVRKPRSTDPAAAGDTLAKSMLKKAPPCPIAPGVTDDASGTAAVIEMARVMSQYEFEKTIVFVAFAGEEEGLVGSTLYAAKARRENRIIDAVLNNDIIGSELAGNGLLENRRIRVFSEHPGRFPSRAAGAIHPGDRRAIRAGHEGRSDVPARSLEPRRRSHAV